MLKNASFAARLQYMIFDEAHCVSEWGSFRPEYKEIGNLRYFLPSGLRILLASATLPKRVLTDVMHSLNLDPDAVKTVHRSNDRPNLNLCVRRIKHSLKSYTDLLFLIPVGWKPGMEAPPKFLVFFDSIAEAVEAGSVLRRQLPKEHRGKILWLHANMSAEFKAETTRKLACGEIWGLCCTDSFGMVSQSSLEPRSTNDIGLGNGCQRHPISHAMESNV